MVYIYNGKLFSLKRKEILSHATTRMNLEDMTLNERSQTQKDKFCVVPLTGGPKRTQIHRDRKAERWVQGLGEGGRELAFHGDGVSVLQDENSFDDGWRWLRNSVNVLNAVEMYTLKSALVYVLVPALSTGASVSICQ